jgi:hypothetical protein
MIDYIFAEIRKSKLYFDRKAGGEFEFRAIKKDILFIGFVTTIKVNL